MTILARPPLTDAEHRELIAEWDAYCRLCTEVAYNSPEQLLMAKRVCAAAGRYVNALRDSKQSS